MLFLGNYESKQIPVKITVTKNGNTLIAQAAGQSPLLLDAIAPNVFQFERAGIVMEFNSDKQEMMLKQGGKEFLFAKQ